MYVVGAVTYDPKEACTEGVFEYALGKVTVVVTEPDAEQDVETTPDCIAVARAVTDER